LSASISILPFLPGSAAVAKSEILRMPNPDHALYRPDKRRK